MLIDVSKMPGYYIGKQKLQVIEDKLALAAKNGKYNVKVDVTGLPLRPEFSIDVARIIDTYGCEFIGLGEKEETIDALVSTGYFIKEALGEDNYGKQFRRLVEMSDFPLMVKDNRLTGDELIIYNVIQPVRFGENYFHYNVLKPYLLEPGELERACWYDKEEIWTKKKTHISDIGSLDAGYRFANTETERTLLDIFTKVIEGTATGFYTV